VDRAAVESYFADLGEDELGLAASVAAQPAAGS
jgi:hypothetical protein